MWNLIKIWIKEFISKWRWILFLIVYKLIEDWLIELFRNKISVLPNWMIENIKYIPAITWSAIPLIVAFLLIKTWYRTYKEQNANVYPLKIEYDENDDRYYFESLNYKNISSLDNILNSTTDDIYFRLSRVCIRNTTGNTIKNVEVKLTDINPCPPRFVKGKLPTNLIIKDDRATPPTRLKDLNPDYPLFVDVIQWQWHGKGKPWFSIQTSIPGIHPIFSVNDTIYKIKIETFGENARCEPKYFYFGLKKKDDGQKKLWMWPAD
jgi:hypothetical protein